MEDSGCCSDPSYTGYIVPTTVATTEGHILEFTADKEYVGYETEYYSVLPRRTTGVRLKFASAEDVIDGKNVTTNAAEAANVQSAADIKYIRLVSSDSRKWLRPQYGDRGGNKSEHSCPAYRQRDL